MKPGLSLLYLAGSSPSEMFAALERYGKECQAWELVDDGSLKLDVKILRKLADYASSYGFEYSVHAPFTDLNIASLNPEVRRLSLKAVMETLEKAYRLNARMVVVHPGFRGPLDYFYPGKAWKANLDSLKSLLRRAENLAVQLTVENMPKGGWPLLSTLKDFEEFFQAEGLEELGVTLDVGHAQTVGQVLPFIGRFGRKIIHVHLHDNLGSQDSHLKIGEGVINWPSTIKALKKIGYSGMLMVESIQKPWESFKDLKKMLKFQLH